MEIGNNLTAVLIIAMFFATIVLLCWIGNRRK